MFKGGSLMMITVKSKIEKGSIRLPKRVKLPDGTQVIVRIEPIQKAKEKQKVNCKAFWRLVRRSDDQIHFRENRPGAAWLFRAGGKSRIILLKRGLREATPFFAQPTAFFCLIPAIFETTRSRFSFSSARCESSQSLTPPYEA
jgi:hypothetical protein